jgi:topoisomerase-4 subunit B
MPSPTYDASAIEVLTGLEPVRRRPGMYTSTERPNHLAHEVVDNAVDEAIAGHCDRIEVTLHEDGSLAVTDNGRGMPVDRHKEEGVSGVEVILTRLHAGAKFSDKNYRFSGGLHGVGVSVVNALSERLVAEVRRHGKVYRMTFAGGEKASELKVVGEVGQRNTGTMVRFWPDAKYFDTAKFHVGRLKRSLRAKAVLCPRLTVRFTDEANPEESAEWCYEEGLADYLADELAGLPLVPEAPFVGHFQGSDEEADWAVGWLPEDGEPVAESYVNLIPTPQGGTHVAGFRAGLTEAIREFCEFRGLLPRGIKLAPEDVWARCTYVLSVRMQDPLFTGQVKERLASREAAAFVSGVAKDSFSLWLNQHVADAEKIAQLAIDSAQARLKAGKKVERKKVTAGPALPGKLADCASQNLDETELFLVEGDSAGGSAKQARSKEFQAILPLRGKILNTWEVDPGEVLASQEVHDIAVALGVDPGSGNLSGLRYGKVCILADADSDGAHIASLLCALFLKHFRPLVEDGRVHVAMPPLYRIDAGKQVYYALDEKEKKGYLDRLEAEGFRGRVNVVRFKGLGEMNPLQLRETTMAPETRRLVQLTLDPVASDGTDADGERGAATSRAAGAPAASPEATSADQILDMLLAKGRVADRKQWLTEKGNLAEV